VWCVNITSATTQQLIKEKLMNLPKFTEVTNPTIKALIHLNDMIRLGSTLKMVKEQALVSGFDSVAKARGFKAAKAEIMAELTNSGLIVV
tara:strand:+ start:22 stop:291 length:270 start_codon:yes stop_codon:yes gene_type:complete